MRGLGSWLIVALAAVLVVALVFVVAARKMPLGVPGEWEWMRVGLAPSGAALLVAGAAVAAYAGFVALGLQTLAKPRSRWVEAAWVAGLLIAAMAIQVAVPTGAPAPYDLAKWAAVNYLPSSTGYFRIAREQAATNPWRFLAEYPAWIRSQDSLHIGTHPPGLIAVQCLLRALMERHPALADGLVNQMPAAVEVGFRVFASKEQPLARADRAALLATALLTLAACAATVVPLYLLARLTLPAHAAWAAAALWPLAPAANLFQPVADTAYPLISMGAMALAAWAVRGDGTRPALSSAEGSVPAASSIHGGDGTRSVPATRWALAIGAGALMGFGMAFTLAFLGVGLIVAIITAFSSKTAWRTRVLVLVAVGIGFAAVLLAGWGITGANPFEIARWNLRNHARFYVEYPRTYRLWLMVNPIELLIALGIPSAVWCAVGLLDVRRVPTPVWATLLVVLLLNLVGRNLGEVARLWMMFMPGLLLAAGIGVTKLGTRPGILAVTVALLGAQTLALQAMIQVVYPV
jgi:methylthioxylose transferase